MRQGLSNACAGVCCCCLGLKQSRMQGAIFHVKRLADHDKSVSHTAVATAKAVALANLARTIVQGPAQPLTTVKPRLALPSDSSSKALAAIKAGQQARAPQVAAAATGAPEWRGSPASASSTSPSSTRMVPPPSRLAVTKIEPGSRFL